MPKIPIKALRQSYLLSAYTAGLAGSLWVAFLLRFDFSIPVDFFSHAGWIFFGLIGTKIILLFVSGQFGSLLSYFGFHDLGKLLAVCVIAAALALGVWVAVGVPFAPPRAVIVTDLLVSFLFLCGFRLSLRLIREGYFDKNSTTGNEKLVVIIGAGDVGASLARDLMMRRGRGLRPKAFFDDDRTKWGTTIHGVIVQGAPESLPDYLHRHRIDQVIIAMPSAAGKRLRVIVGLLNQLKLRFEIVPSYEQLLTGKVKASQIRPVEIQDLLGREAINLQTDRIRELVQNKVVMVTGAGGSIGSELCRQIASYTPSQLLLVERSEFLLFQIEQELIDLGLAANITTLVADITDQERIEGVFQRFKPAVIFHAAAHKHVPMMEQQPAEAFANNTLGTRSLANIALAHRVEHFVLISSDKAINPTNVMGATKRMAELYLQALASAVDGGSRSEHGERWAVDGSSSSSPSPLASGLPTPASHLTPSLATANPVFVHGSGASSVAKPRQTKFMAVRFGNVLGSSGSVIPTFKKQIAAGGPVTITHPDMTRYFMTVNEAVGLVLQSATLGEGGEIFVLDMGLPMKISDLARQLIELSGLEPETDIEIKYTGLRPGEKLFEELNHKTENMVATDHAKVMRFLSQPQTLEQIEAGFDAVQKAGASGDSDQIKLAIQKVVPEYQPYLAARSAGGKI
jgi:FlaA1/EpsC-like NDP-sugar epimerase